MTMKLFKVKIDQAIETSGLSWPTGEERQSETLGGNREYFELGRIGWRGVKELLDLEGELVARFYHSEDPEAAHDEWQEEIDENPDAGLLGFDLGTNALVAALRASRCLPFYSCNGGAFGGHHNDEYPVIAFFCRPQLAEVIVNAAKASSAGVENNGLGGLTIYGESVDTLLKMAFALYSNRSAIAKVRVRSERTISLLTAQGALF